MVLARIAFLLLALMLLARPPHVLSETEGSISPNMLPADDVTAADASATGETSTIATSRVHSRLLPYVPVAACYANQTCEDGACLLQAGTYTSTTGCGAVPPESVSTSNCSCGILCTGYASTSFSSSCPWHRPRLCCTYTYTCRQYAACNWTGPAPFASGGVWNASATTDRKPNAYLAAVMSNYVYEGRVGAAAGNLSDFSAKFTSLVAKPLGFRQAWAYYRDYGLDWVFLESTSSIIAVFRGTGGRTDILVDLSSLGSTATTDFGTPRVGEVRIGTGFFNQFNSSKRYFLSELARFKASVSSSSARKTLWVAGHSLGGAQATLFAAYAHQSGHPVAGVYTFGSPIVGNAAWKAAYPLGSKTYRYEVPGEPVPYLPPFSVNPPSIFSYANHVGTTVSASKCAIATAVSAGHRRRSLATASAAAADSTADTSTSAATAETAAAAAAAVSASRSAARAAAAAAGTTTARGSSAATAGANNAAAAAAGNARAEGTAAAAGGRSLDQQQQQRICGVVRTNLVEDTIMAAAVVVPTDMHLCPAAAAAGSPSSSSSTSDKTAAATAAVAAVVEAASTTTTSGDNVQKSSAAVVTGRTKAAAAAAGTTVAAATVSGTSVSSLVNLLTNNELGHSCLENYVKNIYFCLLSPKEQPAVPSYSRSVALLEFRQLSRA